MAKVDDLLNTLAELDELLSTVRSNTESHLGVVQFLEWAISAPMSLQSAIELLKVDGWPGCQKVCYVKTKARAKKIISVLDDMGLL